LWQVESEEASPIKLGLGDEFGDNELQGADDEQKVVPTKQPPKKRKSEPGACFPLHVSSRGFATCVEPLPFAALYGLSRGSFRPGVCAMEAHGSHLYTLGSQCRSRFAGFYVARFVVRVLNRLKI